MKRALCAVGLALLGATGVAHAEEPASLILNWVAGGDHAPYYYAQKLGWYKTAGIDLNILQGRGSSVAAQAAGAGIDQFGLADMSTILIAIGKGADEVAVMNIYANYPGGFTGSRAPALRRSRILSAKKSVIHRAMRRALSGLHLRRSTA